MEHCCACTDPEAARPILSSSALRLLRSPHLLSSSRCLAGLVCPCLPAMAPQRESEPRPLRFASLRCPPDHTSYPLGSHPTRRPAPHRKNEDLYCATRGGTQTISSPPDS